jgi:glycosyltransferase involved in cell wall biosynthesis
MPDPASRPTVTIVLPTHNRAHLLGRAIRCVMEQTYQQWELVVVDDGSTDGTRDTVAAFADPRIRYLRNERATGPAPARNTGIRAAGPTDYLAFLDDDDEWLPRKLELQLELFGKSPLKPAAVGCGRIDYLDEGQGEVFLPEHRGPVFEDLLARRARGYGAPLIVVRRMKGQPDILFDEDLPCLEDADYGLRIARDGPLDFVPEALVKVYRNDGGEHAWNAEAAVIGYERLARKYDRELRQRPWVRGYYAFCVARELASLGRWGECRARLRQARADWPGSARLRLWSLASFLGPVGLRVASRFLPVRPPRAPAQVATPAGS